MIPLMFTRDDSRSDANSRRQRMPRCNRVVGMRRWHRQVNHPGAAQVNTMRLPAYEQRELPAPAEKRDYVRL